MLQCIFCQHTHPLGTFHKLRNECQFELTGAWGLYAHLMNGVYTHTQGSALRNGEPTFVKVGNSDVTISYDLDTLKWKMYWCNDNILLETHEKCLPTGKIFEVMPFTDCSGVFNVLLNQHGSYVQQKLLIKEFPHDSPKSVTSTLSSTLTSSTKGNDYCSQY